MSFYRAEEILSSQLSNEATTSNIVKIPNSNSDNVFKISYDSPNQPQNFDFPRTGPKGHERSFQPTWFKSFPWLHYDERTDSTFCFTCVKATETNSLSLSLSLSMQFLSQGDAFFKQGFQNWKRATEKSRGFRKHEMSNAHKEAVVRYVKTNPTQPDVVDMVSTEAEKIRFKNRQMLLKILTNVRSLHAKLYHYVGTGTKKSKLEIDSNFHQLLLLRCENEKELQTWLDQSTKKYTSHTMQNEMLQVLALGVFKEISSSILEAEFYTIMADESTDVSNEEKVVIGIRWIDDNLIAHEDFVSLKPVAKCTSKMIVNVIKETINQMRLKVSNLRRQCYDGAAVMAGQKKSVAAKIKEKNPKCLCTHCYGHALNLCVKDACTELPTLTETFAITKEI